ncbi:hypothetical protein HAX54_045277 [Datura stramonium]|uniref:RNase H type-1 domain-containing protein n=1 Tax=Datura stramonium TaxID=4076 RepID=A0ABS8RHY9_DATST|nr:hypothetical protein [Datura stramonium]
MVEETNKNPALKSATQAIRAFICWELWKARCALRYGNKRTTVTTICNEVLFHLKVYFTRNNFHNIKEIIIYSNGYRITHTFGEGNELTDSLETELFYNAQALPREARGPYRMDKDSNAYLQDKAKKKLLHLYIGIDKTIIISTPE